MSDGQSLPDILSWRETFDPFDPSLVAEPHDAYRRMRERDPVHWSPPLKAWVMTRFEDVRAVLMDKSFDVTAPGRTVRTLADKAERDYGHIVRFLENTLFFRTGDGHKRDRRTVATILNRIPLSQLQSTIESIADGLLVDLRSRETFDAVTDFGDVLPQRVMAHILGLRDEDVARLGVLLAEATLVFDPIDLKSFDRIERCLDEALALLADRLQAAVESEPQSPLAFIHSQAGGRDGLADAAALTLFLYRVGSETTMGLLGLAFRELLDDPVLAQRLRDDTSLIPGFVGEALRLESNVQRVVRTARADRVVGGQAIHAGERVLLLLGAANRDPAIFSDPDLTCPHGRPPDLAFGAGRHFCLGASLTTLEGRIAVGRFLALPDLQRAGAERWYAGRSIRRLVSLPVRKA